MGRRRMVAGEGKGWWTPYIAKAGEKVWWKEKHAFEEKEIQFLLHRPKSWLKLTQRKNTALKFFLRTKYADAMIYRWYKSGTKDIRRKLSHTFPDCKLMKQSGQTFLIWLNMAPVIWIPIKKMINKNEHWIWRRRMLFLRFKYNANGQGK